MSTRILALLTDFGTQDAYVGVMKAVVLGRYPHLRLVDLTHEVPPHNLLSGAYLLYSAWDYLPAGTAVCAVVDPGVGSSRGALLGREGGRYLVAPDNGLLSLVARMKPHLEVFTLETAAIPRLFPALGSGERPQGGGPPQGRKPATTFDGRELFAPAAALCAAGQARRVLGGRLEPLRLPEVLPSSDEGQGPALRGCILHVDRFGNCITSLHRLDLERRLPQGRFTVQAGTLTLRGLRRSYAEAQPAEALALIGSAGFLEISVREGSAAADCRLSVGDGVRVRESDSDA